MSTQVIRWRLEQAGQAISDLPMKSVSYVDFIPTKEWEEAELAFSEGDFNEAGKLYSQIAANRGANFYPVPGNFASLALKRILECHRRLMNAQQVAEIARKIQPVVKSLPPSEQDFSPEDKAWIAAGNGKWEEVIQTAQGAPPGSTELSYLAGLANHSTGKAGEALDGFTAAYTLGFGSHPEIARASLRAAAEILANVDDDERRPELQAQLKIYQELYGKGKLWEGAPTSFVELAKADLNTIDIGIDDRETVIPPLPEMPLQKDRDWLLSIELDKPVYVPGSGEFVSEKESAPEKRGNALVFSGTQSMKKEGIKINTPTLRFQAVFIPESKDGILFNAGKNGPGFMIYIQGGQMMFAWKDQGDNIKEIALGPVVVGAQASMVIALRNDGVVRARVSPQSMQDFGKVPIPIRTDGNTILTVAPQGKGNNIMGKDLPGFKGVIRHLSAGFASSQKDIIDAETKMFEGKRVVMSVPRAQ